jgi:hypothetical protein
LAPAFSSRAPISSTSKEHTGRQLRCCRSISCSSWLCAGTCCLVLCSAACSR